ncbi:MAG: apolipoprotein N-acyltransferase [Aquiluna sp.]|nr:apolipoprotein N-acyltransferase [Aquiluna sp.]MCF8544995.1 apolipoprotein N-acyltransferase [Aquiluna sp.]
MRKDLIWRLPLGILGGLLGLYAFPTENVFWIAPLIPAMILIATLGTTFPAALLIGFLAGQAFYISHIEWLSLYLGPVPLLALSTLMSFYFAFGTAVTSWLYGRLKPKGLGLVHFALAAAGIWTLREWLSNNFPYGGFPWSRLSMTQSDSFMSHWVYWGGLSLLSFVIAAIGSLLALLLIDRKFFKRRGQIATFSTLSALLVIPLIAPLGLGTSKSGEITMAAVQGNANAGLFSNLSRGTILDNHIEATRNVIESGQKVDLLVWPENASDLDPLRSEAARAKIDAVANSVDAPFIFGTITKRGEDTYNSTLLWEPGIGPTDYYDKKRPVPFAEYVPDRDFWRMLAPDLIDLVPRGYSFGTRDGIYELDKYRAGSLICFEIAADDISRGLALDGANIILSQTNNADFGYSDETYQQAAIARLRAIETGRVVVNISTVGLSEIYLPSGDVADSLPWYEAGAMVTKVPLYEGATPAMSFGVWFDLINAIIVFIALANGLRKRRTRR